MPRQLPMKKCVKSQLGTTLHHEIRPARFKNRPIGVETGGIARCFMRRAPAEDDYCRCEIRRLAARGTEDIWSRFEPRRQFSPQQAAVEPRRWDPAIFSRAGVAFPNQAPPQFFGAKRPENRV